MNNGTPKKAKVVEFMKTKAKQIPRKKTASIKADGIKVNTLDIISSSNKFNLESKKNVDDSLCSYVKKEKSTRNITFHYNLARIFNFTDLKRLTFKLIERYFSSIIEDSIDNYLELDFHSVSIILNSSELESKSEYQVFDAAVKWLMYKKRENLTHKVLKLIRINLLSDLDLNKILLNLKIQTDRNCAALIEQAINCKNDPQSIIFNSKQTHRYCTQSKVLVFESGNNNQVLHLDPETFDEIKTLPSFLVARTSPKAVVLNGDVYLFGGKNNRQQTVRAIEKYSFLLNTWSRLNQMYDDREHFCLCPLDKHHIIVIGGDNGIDIDNTIQSSLIFNPNKLIWKAVSNPTEKRSLSACVFYNGNAVVSGGCRYDGLPLKSVEYFDNKTSQWFKLGDMNEGKYDHSLVGANNKLFAFGKTCNEKLEVYENKTDRFEIVQQPPLSASNLLFWNNSVLVGKCIVMFPELSELVFCYDYHRNNWTIMSCESLKNISNFSILSL